MLKSPGSVRYRSDGAGDLVSVNIFSPPVYSDGFEYGGRAYHRVSRAGNSHMVRAEPQAALNQKQF